MYLDEYGIIGQIQSDGKLEGGDSLNWQGHRIYFKNTKMSSEEYHKFFSAGFGYVRHPKSESSYTSRSTEYYRNPWNGAISRDQLTGVIAAFVADVNVKRALRLLLHHACWGFLFAYNTVRNGNDLSWKWPDFTGPDVWAMELRMFGKFSWVFYPILLILDLHNLFNTIYYNKLGKDNDVISYAMKLIVCKENVPTIVSRLSFRLVDRQKICQHLLDYWCGWRKNCGMADLYIARLLED